MRTSRLQRRVGAITLPILVMALAACGGGTSNSQVASLNGATGNSNALAPTTTLSVQAREQKLLDFQGRSRTHEEMIRTWRLTIAPTLLFFGPGAREVAERMEGGYLPDFYRAYLEQRLEVARANL